MARLLGFETEVELHLDPEWSDGANARTWFSGDGDCSPLSLSIMARAPSFLRHGADWQSLEFKSDRARVQPHRPAHWPTAEWDLQVEIKTREFVLTDDYRFAFDAACKEIEQQARDERRTVIVR